ncbi:TetR/AcrR family transcriptional regulator [Microlunatus sp. GCM10028923]|uniref:TetR/AcrR family transcriptional regulator n=1 Tax=Microlunatus sp. GCM10028923 TaxID=3273400 RepID=UPI003609B068
MTVTRNPDTRQRLLEAAADLIAASPGQDVPLRAICDRVGVKLPTLYHFFGSKEGLLDAVIAHGFDVYLGLKESHESSGDPIQDLRDGWDAHVAFGLANPGFYALMYGQVTPGRRPSAQDRPGQVLRGLTKAAADQGRLVVPPEQAAAHILAANIGVTLRQIVLGEPDPELSAAMREGTLAAITGTAAASGRGRSQVELAAASAALLDQLSGAGAVLGEPEVRLLRKWLTALAR